MSTFIFKNVDPNCEYSEWNGFEVKILGVISDPDDESLTSVASMPMLRIHCLDTGQESNFWPEEVEESHWPEELKAVLLGMKAFGDPTASNPYPSSSPLATRFDQGLKIAKLKP